ncbi:Histone deacetylase hda1 [Mortierella sp. GBA43]|nr:Histone deacetylase hda1 [Mortierella sp. GBA43]
MDMVVDESSLSSDQVLSNTEKQPELENPAPVLVDSSQKGLSASSAASSDAPIEISQGLPPPSEDGMDVQMRSGSDTEASKEDVIITSPTSNHDSRATSVNSNGQGAKDKTSVNGVSAATDAPPANTNTSASTSASASPTSSSGATVNNGNTSTPTAAPLPQPDIMDGRSTKTGYVYDVRMRFHSNVHGEDDHPEDPRRIWRIYEALKNAGCTNRMIKVPSREATIDELRLIHSDEHIESIQKTAEMSKEELLVTAENYNSIYLNNLSAFCARLSCGSLLELCKAVATGQVLNGVAIVRPPGHHAEPDEAGGFCLFNNVAIAARYLQKHHHLKKIFILDWDVHHGNGTQAAFIDDPNVVYCSIHRYDDGSFYPGDPVAAAHTTVGEGPGRGRNINIPWPCRGMGDSEYIYAFHKVIMPIVYEFAPDFILVSAGFDAAKGK